MALTVQFTWTEDKVSLKTHIKQHSQFKVLPSSYMQSIPKCLQ